MLKKGVFVQADTSEGAIAIGPSGSGKTGFLLASAEASIAAGRRTLLHCPIGRIRPVDGAVWAYRWDAGVWDGEPLYVVAPPDATLLDLLRLCEPGQHTAIYADEITLSVRRLSAVELRRLEEHAAAHRTGMKGVGAWTLRTATHRLKADVPMGLSKALHRKWILPGYDPRDGAEYRSTGVDVGERPREWVERKEGVAWMMGATAPEQLEHDIDPAMWDVDRGGDWR